MWLLLLFIVGALLGATFIVHMRDEELRVTREENRQLQEENRQLKGEIMEADYFIKGEERGRGNCARI